MFIELLSEWLILTKGGGHIGDTICICFNHGYTANLLTHLWVALTHQNELFGPLAGSKYWAQVLGQILNPILQWLYIFIF